MASMDKAVREVTKKFILSHREILDEDSLTSVHESTALNRFTSKISTSGTAA